MSKLSESPFWDERNPAWEVLTGSRILLTPTKLVSQSAVGVPGT